MPYIPFRYIYFRYIEMKHANTQPESWLPLKTNVLFILLALADGQKHGYAIMQETQTTSEGLVRMGPGTLYGTLQRLIERGLIEETDKPSALGQDDERRRYYRLTSVGNEVITAEVRRLEQLVKTARTRSLIPRLG